MRTVLFALPVFCALALPAHAERRPPVDPEVREQLFAAPWRADRASPRLVLRDEYRDAPVSTEPTVRFFVAKERDVPYHGRRLRPFERSGGSWITVTIPLHGK